MIAPVLHEYFRAARRYVAFTSPDLEFDLGSPKDWTSQMVRLLQKKASSEGLAVDLVANGYAGGLGEISYLLKGSWIGFGMDRLAEKAAQHTRRRFQQLQTSPSIRIWTYLNYMHAKQYYFDGLASFIGSFNFDEQSAAREYESGILCLDEDLTRGLSEQLALDLSNSAPFLE